MCDGTYHRRSTDVGEKVSERELTSVNGSLHGCEGLLKSVGYLLTISESVQGRLSWGLLFGSRKSRDRARDDVWTGLS